LFIVGKRSYQREIEEMEQLKQRVNKLRQENDVEGLIGTLESRVLSLKHLADNNDEICITIVNTLGEIGNERAIVPLVNILEKVPFGRLTITIVGAFEQIGGDKAMEALIKLFSDPVKGIRNNLGFVAPTVSLAAIHAVGRIGEPAVRPLLKALDDVVAGKNRHLGIPVLTMALDIIGKPAIEPLTEFINNEKNAKVRKEARIIRNKIQKRK